MSFTFNWVSTPGQNNNFVNGSINSGSARAFLDDGQVDPFDSPLYICIPPISFEGGNAGAATLLDFARTIATCGLFSRVQNPARNYRGNQIGGGNFTLNGNPCGKYEFNVLPGGTTLTQETIATLFSDTNDISTWIVCKGNLTIPPYTVLTPTVNPEYDLPGTNSTPDPDAKRRLFMVVYVTGNLTFSDSTSIISMNARGGNTSGSGANISSFNIPIASNLRFGLDTNINPTIQSVGAAGGAVSLAGNGNPGDNAILSPNGSSLYTGGGGSGLTDVDGGTSGAGGAGSPFSGGTGGGSAVKGEIAPANASSLGGTGGSGSSGATVGGTGNPGGLGDNGGPSGLNGFDGTGGILIVIAEGTFVTDGLSPNIRACGIDGTNFDLQASGASGGGIIALIQSSTSGTFPETQAFGGTGGEASFGFNTGGNGGNGSAYNYGINS
jgi:hypothetical protein